MPPGDTFARTPAGLSFAFRFYRTSIVIVDAQTDAPAVRQMVAEAPAPMPPECLPCGGRSAAMDIAETTQRLALPNLVLVDGDYHIVGPARNLPACVVEL